MRDLERRRPRPSICPEHATAPRSRDYRDGLAPFLPDPTARAVYHAEMDALEATPPCPRCGWKDEPFFWIVCREGWGQYGPA